MKRYLLRSLKYFVMLCLLLVGGMVAQEQRPAALGGAPEYLGYTQVYDFIDELADMGIMWQMLQLYFSAWNGWVMAVMIVVLSATYPYFGFVRRTVVANIAADREQIEAAMVTAGLVLKSVEGNTLTFRATGLQRLTLLFEDDVVVEQQGDEVVISGHRRTVVRAVIRLEGYLVNKRRGNE